MGLKLSSPSRRKGTAKLQFHQRVPQDLLPYANEQTVEIPIAGRIHRIKIKGGMLDFSLRTPDPREANARYAIVFAALSEAWVAMRAKRDCKPLVLSHKQLVALAGQARQL